VIFRQGPAGEREEHGELLEIGDGLVLSQNADGQPLLSTGVGAPPAIPTPGEGPARVPDCELWLRSDSLLLSLADTNAVSFWPDVSGNTRHGNQATVAEQPAFNTNILNGKPVVTFAGSPQDFAGDSIATGALTSAAARTVFLVARRTGGYDDRDRFLDWGNIAGVGGEILDLNGVWAFAYTEGGAFQSLGGVTTNFTLVALNFASASSVTPYLNGVAGTAFDHNDSGLLAGVVRVGAETDSSDRAIAGQAAEVIFFRRSLSASEMGLVTTDVNNRYNLF